MEGDNPSTASGPPPFTQGRRLYTRLCRLYHAHAVRISRSQGEHITADLRQRRKGDRLRWMRCKITFSRAFNTSRQLRYSDGPKKEILCAKAAGVNPRPTEKTFALCKVVFLISVGRWLAAAEKKRISLCKDGRGDPSPTNAENTHQHPRQSRALLRHVEDAGLYVFASHFAKSEGLLCCPFSFFARGQKIKKRAPKRTFFMFNFK